MTQQKKTNLAQACLPGTNMLAVPRRHGFVTSLVSRWRRTLPAYISQAPERRPARLLRPAE
ncbi:hypothetical protein FEZ63_00540 [Microvirga brassicacearum]|uniref:Uncharacterized protein n=1 Tax=Microvirga brassicacearum TaxID=2580413 RepID=A0A5N3PJI3_9HYPH|nr:hypothetical protein FEZ63_00540 [Microvirga brassicacearum]